VGRIGSEQVWAVGGVGGVGGGGKARWGFGFGVAQRRSTRGVCNTSEELENKTGPRETLLQPRTNGGV
jgi:hypothetical protein